MIEKISQSFVKDMREYFAGEECGNIIREKYINDRLLEDEEPGSMARGAYFEYRLTEYMLGPGKGSLPKNGKIPQPEFMPSKIKANKNSTTGLLIADMDSNYRKIENKTIKLVADYLTGLGIKIVANAKTYTKGRLVGTIDLVCEATRDIQFSFRIGSGIAWKKGDRFIIDLKYSGLLNDRWNKHGWMWSKIQKEYHGTQAIQYHFITDLPFYFFVVQSNQAEADTPEVKFFSVPVTEEDISRHLEEGNALMEKFKTTAEFGFVARPALNKCNECPLREECSDRHRFPHPEVVSINVYDE